MSWLRHFSVLLLIFLIYPNCLQAMAFEKDPKDSTHLSLPDSVKVFGYGYVNFFALFTRMQEVYGDYAYSHRNVTFAPYPDPGLVNRNAEQPFLFLGLEMHRKDIIAKINWHIVHSFTSLDGGLSKNILFRMPPSLEMVKYTKVGEFNITAGNCTGKTFISPLTLAGQSLVNHPFDRLPWDWYSSPFDKYASLYHSAENPLKVLGLNASQGFLFAANNLFKKWSAKIFYGRTNFTTTPIQIEQRLPSYVAASKLSRTLGKHIVGGNFYYKYILPSQKGVQPIETQIYSLDYQSNFFNRITWGGEVAVNSNSFSKKWNLAFFSNIQYTPSSKDISLSLGAYHIPYDFVSLDNAILNTNTLHTISGLPNDHLYNLTLYVNPLQAPDVMSNNRQGIMSKIVFKAGKWRVELEQAFTKEIEHKHDSLTFFHTANAFTRSRFTPWLQGSGPYGRVGGRYRFTTETIPFATKNSFQFFSLQWKFLYKTLLFQKEWLLIVNPSYNQASTNALLSPALNTACLDVSSFLRITPKTTLLLMAIYQRTRSASIEPFPIEQQGVAAGIGTDIEIGKNAAFHLRYKRFGHWDNNYEKDLFKGDEVVTEIKIFF